MTTLARFLGDAYQYLPLALTDQIIILFAGSRGYLDDLALDKVKKFEEGLTRFIRESYSNLLADISEKKELNKDLEERLAGAVAGYKKSFT